MAFGQSPSDSVQEDMWRVS